MEFSYKYTRYSAIAQILIGILSIIFGIADRAYTPEKFRYTIHSYSATPIWMGAWFVITGVIGWFGSNRNYARNGRASRPLIGTYLGFSVVSIVFAGVIIIIYSLGIAIVATSGRPCAYRRVYLHHRSYTEDSTMEECQTSVALGSMVVIFAIMEFCVGIWASICCCSNGCCDCCVAGAPQAQVGQVVYVQTQQGPAAYIMTQSANGVPVAIPAVAQGQGEVQMNPSPTPQVIYPAPYVGGAVGGSAIGCSATERDAQAPPLQQKGRDMPPSYQV